MTTLNQNLKKEYEKKFGWMEDSSDDKYTFREIWDWITSVYGKKVREEAIKEMVNLSDKLELEGNTTLEEWKAFKGFRNRMRDYLSPTQKKGKI
jgi:hypothetical protein